KLVFSRRPGEQGGQNIRPAAASSRCRMAIAIHFDKAKAERLLDCLGTGKPIPPVQGVDDILALGGACFFLALSHGPDLQKAADVLEVPDAPLGGKDTFVPEIHAALEYYGQLMLLVANGEYEDHFGAKHRAVVYIDDNEKTVVPLDGMHE